MVIEVFYNIFFSIIELLRLSFILSIPMLACAIVIKAIASRLMKRYEIGFAKASMFSTYLVVLVLIIVLYSFPLYLGYLESPLTQQPKPLHFQFTLIEFLAELPSLALKLLLKALAFTLLIMPLEFVAIFAFETIKNKLTAPKTFSVFAGVFVSAIVTVLITLIVFPFAVTGLVYFLYFT